MLIIMLPGKLCGGDENLDADQFESASLKAANDVRDKRPMDTVRLDHNE